MVAGLVAWLPDGKTLVVSRRELDGDAPTDLLLLDVSGRILRTVKLSRPIIVDSGIAVLPNGESAVVAAHPVALGEGSVDLFRVDLATGATTQLTDTAAVDESRPAALGNDAVVYSAIPHIGDDGTAGPTWVAVLDLSSQSSRDVTSRKMSFGQATVSRDGEHILYHALPTGAQPNNEAVWAVPAKGGKARLLIRSLHADLLFPSLDDSGAWVQTISPLIPWANSLFASSTHRCSSAYGRRGLHLPLDWPWDTAWARLANVARHGPPVAA